MKREDIENRDQELIKKYRELIRSKEKKPEEEMPPSRLPIKLFFLLAALGLSSILIIQQHSPTPVPTIPVSKMTEASSREQVITPPKKQPKPKTFPLETKVLSHSQNTLAPLESMEDKTPVQKATEPEAPTIVIAKTIQPVMEYTPPAQISHEKREADMPSGIRIEKIISCTGVNDRQYSSPRTEFSLARDTTPWVWMTVMSENPPFTLTHVYYCNGQKYCEVPLAIRYHRMRTWSRVSLESPDHIGRWRVEVVDDRGSKLDQVEFLVVE